MAGFHNDVYDNGLNELTNATTPVLYLCSAEPTSHTEASATYAIGSKSAPTVGSPTDGSPSGRSVSVSTFTDGSVTADDDGDEQWWAFCDDDDNRLLAWVEVAVPQALTNGNNLEMTSALVFNFADPA